MRKAGLKLVITDLVVARVTLWASSATTYKRQRDTIAGLPVGNVLANSFDNAGKLMSWHMRKADIRIMPHPAVPIAATQPRRSDRNHHAADWRFGIRQRLNAEWPAKCVINCSFQILFELNNRFETTEDQTFAIERHGMLFHIHPSVIEIIGHHLFHGGIACLLVGPLDPGEYD